MSSYETTTNSLFQQASAAMTQAGNQARRIQHGSSVSTRRPRMNVELQRPDLGPPPSFGELFEQGDGTASEAARLNGFVNQWLSSYFPNLTGCFSDIPDQWLCDVVSGSKPFGVDATVFEVVWQRARDRTRRTLRQERRDIEAAFSEQGFALPPGAMIEAQVRAQERLDDEVGDVNREQAAREAHIKQEILQFAVGEATRYKNNIMQSLASFVQIWSQIPNNDIERARIRATAYSSLYQALSAYYGVEHRFEELKLRREEGNLRGVLEGDRNRVAASSAGDTNQAFGQAVRAFGDVAANAANAASTLSSEILAI